MSAPGRFSLVELVTQLRFGPVTLIAAVTTLVASFLLTRETLSKIPELFEVNFGYDKQLQDTLTGRNALTGSLPVTFVDIDSAAVDAWSPATRTTPRDKLKDIIAHLLPEKPKLIFVDFDLSGSDADHSDAALNSFLSNYPPDGPPLLLTRAIEPVECQSGNCAGYQCPNAGSAVPPLQQGSDPQPSTEPAASFLDSTAGKANIIWVSTVFAPDGDGVVRSWRLWDLACIGGHLRLMPSPQLVAAALAPDHPPGITCLKTYLERHGDVSLVASGECKTPWPANANAYDALIPFIIGGPTKARVSNWSAANGFSYQRVLARSLLADEVATSALADRVVVVGATYGRDRLRTPLGIMPGAAVIANAIAVAPAVLNTAPNFVAVTVFTLLLAGLNIWIAKVFRALPAAVLIFVVAYVGLLVGNVAFGAADAVNIAWKSVALLAIFLGIESFLEIVADITKGERSRAFLRDRHEKESL